MADPILSLEGVSKSFGPIEVLHGVDFELRPGEIHALIGENGAGKSTTMKILGGYIDASAGLVGAGRTELAEAIAGLRPRGGRVRLMGETLPAGQVKTAMERGLVYLTEDRKGAGLLLDKGLRENLTLPLLDRFGTVLIDRKAEEAALDKAIADFAIRAPERDMPVGNLSGGNQQKLLLAKTLLSDPQVILIDEPTRGIDIGTKQQIYTLISGLAAAGHAIIVISSEMPELIGLASRVLVMHAGRIVGGLEGDDVNEGAIVRLAMGLGETREEAAA
jgi:ribose transport system ATP-binding protein